VPGLTSGVDLLEQAVGYTLGTLRYATDHTLSRPSPCGDWDLRVLLAHMVDSFTALEEAALTGDVSLSGAPMARRATYRTSPWPSSGAELSRCSAPGASATTSSPSRA
jgi:Mycothiol maleylpyruvate isomerase N-terminal domain